MLPLHKYRYFQNSSATKTKRKRETNICNNSQRTEDKTDSWSNLTAAKTGNLGTKTNSSNNLSESLNNKTKQNSRSEETVDYERHEDIADSGSTSSTTKPKNLNNKNNNENYLTETYVNANSNESQEQKAISDENQITANNKRKRKNIKKNLFNSKKNKRPEDNKYENSSDPQQSNTCYNCNIKDPLNSGSKYSCGANFINKELIPNSNLDSETGQKSDLSISTIIYYLVLGFFIILLLNVIYMQYI